MANLGLSIVMSTGMATMQEVKEAMKVLTTNGIDKKNITILIGPEGDFSVKEIAMALEHQFIPVTLGETRLRTETAAVVACHSVAYTNE